jgi:hypothetical protein
VIDRPVTGGRAPRLRSCWLITRSPITRIVACMCESWEAGSRSVRAGGTRLHSSRRGQRVVSQGAARLRGDHLDRDARATAGPERGENRGGEPSAR